MGVAKNWKMVDLEMELGYLIFFQHLDELCNFQMERYFIFPIEKNVLLLIFNHIVAFTLLSARFFLHGLYILM